MKKLSALLLCAVSFCAAFAAKNAALDTPIGAKFGASMSASLQDPKMEWWFNLPPDAAPRVTQAERVYFHQEFSLFSFFTNAGVRDGKFRIDYSIESKSPDGKKTTVSKDVKLEGSKPSQSVIVASTDNVGVCFDKNYNEGLYTFTMRAKDAIENRTSETKAYVRLVEWSAPAAFQTEAQVREAIFGFYLDPSPDTLWSAYFSKAMSLEQKGAPNNLNYIYVGFFRAAFKRNSFLLPKMREAFKDASPIDRAKIVFIFAVLDEARIDITQLSEREKKYQEAIRNAEIPHPHKEWHPVLGSVQIDMLWGEFFADGTYAPIKRIMGLLSNVEEAAFVDAMKAARSKPANREDFLKFMKGAYQKAALHTLVYNAGKYPLVKNYCMWALENEKLPKSSYELLAPVLDTGK